MWTLRSHLATSLAVQRLRLHVPNAGGLGSIRGQGTRSHTLKLKSLCAVTKRSCLLELRPSAANKYFGEEVI